MFRKSVTYCKDSDNASNAIPALTLSCCEDINIKATKKVPRTMTHAQQAGQHNQHTSTSLLHAISTNACWLSSATLTLISSEHA